MKHLHVDMCIISFSVGGGGGGGGGEHKGNISGKVKIS